MPATQLEQLAAAQCWRGVHGGHLVVQGFVGLDQLVQFGGLGLYLGLHLEATEHEKLGKAVAEAVRKAQG